MTHEQEEKAEIPFFKSGKHPTKKQMAGKMAHGTHDINRTSFSAVGSHELKKRANMTQDRHLRNEIYDELNSRFSKEHPVGKRFKL